MGADAAQMVMVAGGALAFAATVLGRRKNRRQRSPPSVDQPDVPTTQAAALAMQPDISPAAAPEHPKPLEDVAATPQEPFTNGKEAPPSPDVTHASDGHILSEVEPADAPPTPNSAGVAQESGSSPATFSDAETPPTGLSRNSQGTHYGATNGSVSGGVSSSREIVQKLRNQLRSREDIIYEMQGQMRELELLSNRQVARCGELERAEAQAQKARNVVVRENFEVREELKRVGKKVEGLVKDKEELEEEVMKLRSGMSKGQKGSVGVGDLETRNGQLERELREVRGQYGPLQERQVASLQRNLAAAVERQQEAERELNVALREVREANESRHEARGSERRAEEREREAVTVAERLRRDIEGVEEELREARKGWERAKQELEGVAREGDAERKSLHRAIADLKMKLDSEVAGSHSAQPDSRIQRQAPRIRSSVSSSAAPPTLPTLTPTRTTSLAVKRPLWADREESPASTPANKTLPATQSGRGGGATAEGMGIGRPGRTVGSKGGGKKGGSVEGLQTSVNRGLEEGGSPPPAPRNEGEEQVEGVGREGNRQQDSHSGQGEGDVLAKQLDGMNHHTPSKRMEQKGDGGDGAEEGKQNGFVGGTSDTASDGTLDDLLDNALDDMFQVCSNTTTPVKAQRGEEGR